MDDNEKRTDAQATVVSNFTLEATDGNKKIAKVPKPITEIIDDIYRQTKSWPRRVDKMLFLDDEFGLNYLDRRGAAGLMGWLHRQALVQWSSGDNYVSEAELFAELERTAKQYDAIEVLPHEPPIANIYYRGDAPAPGDGTYLGKLLDRFRPETTADRDLIQAAIMTTIWGGPAGCRPIFVFTSDSGRGTGKSTAANIISRIAQGHIDVSAGEDIEQLKQRLLTPAARTRRIALLDNVKTMRLSWAEMEALVTSEIISGKQLYIGEAQRPNLLTWLVTLNGVSLATDIAQRSVIIKLVGGENSGPWLEETIDYIETFRQQIIGDVIAALRSDPWLLAKYSRWATWEKDVLSRLPEPGEAQKVILERQGEANVESEEAEIIEDFFAAKLADATYNPDTAQVRIPVSICARWFSEAVGDRMKTAAVTRKILQMEREGQIKRLSLDPSRTYGRSVIWTGAAANVEGESISNDLITRLEETESWRKT